MYCIFTEKREFYFIEIKRNGNLVTIHDGDILYLNPRDIIKIEKISTGICLQRGVSLFCEGIDIKPLLKEELPIWTLLPSKDILKDYRYKIQIKKGEFILGEFTIDIRPTEEDILERLRTIIGREKRLSFLKRAKSLFPKSEKITDALISEYERQSRWKEAISLLKRKIKRAPNKEDLLRIIRCLQITGDKDQVTVYLRKLISLEPENPVFRIRLADLYVELKRYRKAAIQYEKALKVLKGDENRFILYRNLGYLYRKLKEVDKAIKWLIEASKISKEPEIYYVLSRLYEEKGDKRRASEYLSKVISLKPKDLDSRIKMATLLYQLGRLKEAKGHLRFVLRHRSDDLDALVMLSKIAEKEGNKGELRSIYEKILKVDPKNENVIHNLAILYYEMGSYGKCIKYLQTLIRLHPKSFQYHMLLFNSYRRLKQDSKAYKVAIKLIKLRPKDKRIYPFIFEYLKKRARYRELVNIFKNAVKYNPKDIQLRRFLAYSFIKTDNLGAAKRELEFILKLRPKEKETLYQLAILEEKLGNIDKAISLISKAFDIDKKDVRILKSYKRLLWERAKQREKAGDYRGAKSDYEKIMRLWPEEKEAEEGYLRMRLKELEIR